MLICDFSKMSMPSNLHLAFQALSEFQKQYSALPKPWDNVNFVLFKLFDFKCIVQDDAEKFYEITVKLNTEGREQPLTDELNKHWIKLFAKTCQGDLCPMQAVIGGIAAQEAMKVR